MPGSVPAIEDGSGLAEPRPAGCFDTVDVLAMPTSPVIAPPASDFARYLMALARNATAASGPAASVWTQRRRESRAAA